MIQLTLVNQSKTTMPRRFMEGWVRAVEGRLRRRRTSFPKGAELTIVFLDRGAARRLNRDHRGRDYATDVLSFEGDGPFLGELIICPSVVKRQAVEHDLSFRAELAYMILHGLLHLLGFDHERNAKQARRMFALQDGIFEELSRLHSPS